jgi:transposase
MTQKRNQKSYDNEYKAQAVKLAQEIGGHKAAVELGIPDGTIYCWIKAFKEGRLESNQAVHTPTNALTLNEEIIQLKKRLKEQDKEIRRLKEENEFLEEASAFFAASRRKSAKIKE